MEKVILVGVGSNKEELNESLLELENLALANNYEVVDVFKQHLNVINSFGYVQKGKLEEIKEFFAENEDVKILIANDELSASQIKNISNKLEDESIQVLDRTILILDIFKTRAKTKEAKLQVEIASLQHSLAHLVLQDENYDQQRGGTGTSNRGQGEKKIDIDRRLLKERIHLLKDNLKEVVKAQQIQKKQRIKSEMLLVSLVGYTNAGKSTIMNNLVNEDFNKKVFEKNMLFATLDTSVRKIYLPNNREVLLSDTVGFIDKLPHQLINSFKSTLEEAVQADLILHVVDYSNDDYQRHINVTNKTLKEIGVDSDVPMVYVYNKADKIEGMAYPKLNEDGLIISAKDQRSIDMLKEVIADNLFSDIEEVVLYIPYRDSNKLDYLYKEANIITHEQADDYHIIRVELTRKELDLYQRYLKDEL